LAHSAIAADDDVVGERITSAVNTVGDCAGESVVAVHGRHLSGGQSGRGGDENSSEGLHVDLKILTYTEVTVMMKSECDGEV